MAIFGLEVDNTVRLNKIVKSLNERLEKPDMFQNPFNGFVKFYKGKEPYLFVYLNIVWINPTYFTIFLALALFMGYGFRFTWLHSLLVPMFLGSLMFTKQFLRLMIRYYIIRKGYKGLIKSMSDKDLLLRLAEWGKEK